MRIAQAVEPETQLEMFLDDIITKELPALHEKYAKQKTITAKHYINHPEQTQTITYKSWPINLPRRTNLHFDELTIEAKNNQGENLYTITRTNNPLGTTTKLRTRISRKDETPKLFFSELFYLHEKEEQPTIQRTKELSNYLRNLLND